MHGQTRIDYFHPPRLSDNREGVDPPRLEKFKEVILDFTDVHEVSPAFTDELFRVFAKQHPNTHLIAVNANEQVTKMIRRAESHGASEAE